MSSTSTDNMTDLLTRFDDKDEFIADDHDIRALPRLVLGKSNNCQDLQVLGAPDTFEKESTRNM